MTNKEKNLQLKRKSVCCLCIDMFGSTKFLLNVTDNQLKIFYGKLIEQINPHLQGTELINELIKFTGDGWLIMTDELDKFQNLSCLAKIMVHKFQLEMGNFMKKYLDLTNHPIPSLRVALCGADDYLMDFPGGRIDFVGDSVRRAVRVVGICNQKNKEVLIDEFVKDKIRRSFNTIELKESEINERLKNTEKWEEELNLHLLNEPKYAIIEEIKKSETPKCFIYYFNVMGEKEKAKEAKEEVLEDLEKETPKIDPKDIISHERVLRRWNSLISSQTDYTEIVKMYNMIKATGFKPNINTYNILIDHSKDLETVRNWYEELIAANLKPSVDTFHFIIIKSPKYDIVEKWYDKLIADGLKPDITIYNKLIHLSVNLDAVEKWFQRIKVENLEPDVVTYVPPNNLSKDLETLEKWLQILTKSGLEPGIVTYTILINISKDLTTAEKWFKELIDKNIEPNIYIYNSLINLSKDFATAKEWFLAMKEQNIRPNTESFTNIFLKQYILDIPAKELYEWFVKQEYHPEKAIISAIKKYRDEKNIDQTLALVIHYPHLPTSIKAIKDFKNCAIKYFQSFSENDPLYSDAVYALGIAYMELGNYQEAKPCLEKASQLTNIEKRKEEIQRRLLEIERKLAENS